MRGRGRRRDCSAGKDLRALGSWWLMRIRGPAPGGQRGLLLPLAGLLGAAVVVLPAVAGSETAPRIEASQSGIYFRWQPSAATVNAGGAVTFANPSTEVNHGVEWKSG